MEQEVLCPVCEKHRFAEENDFDICPVCGWENDGVQGADHDYWGGANDLTVNDSKRFYLLSQEMTKKDRLLQLQKQYRENCRKIHKKYQHIDHRVDGDQAIDEFYVEYLRYRNEINKLST